VKHAKLILFLIFAAMLRFDCPGQTPTKPLLGAQIWIEPGQTPAQIDGWFHELEKQQMPVARIFIMWPYIEPARDQWDFTLYDAVFQSAEKYHVRIVATLTPTGIPPFMGGSDVQNGGIVGSEDARKESAQYIAKVVERYKGSPALDTWLLANEPGEAPKPQPLAITGYRTWLEKQYGTVEALNRSWTTGYKSFAEVDPALKQSSWNANSAIDWDSFWREYQTAGLQWIADEVHRHDQAHPLHVNPHALISNLAGLSDDLPAWRAFLDTMGCSIHPAWHFGLLNRDRYALGVSYINDLVAGSIEPKPHWVTELQGGNNIYSGAVPMEPTAD
jgi:beta-galactosidase